jgi:hypothetical protein
MFPECLRQSGPAFGRGSVPGSVSRQGSGAIVHISELHFRRVVEPGYLPRALPKLEIVIINQLPGLLHGRVIIGAFQ